MNKSFLEPEFQEHWSAYTADPTSRTAKTTMLQALKPTIDRGVRVFVGRKPSPMSYSQARRLALQSLRTYDPTRSKLSTHVTNHMQGLRRVTRQQTNVLSVPERLLLERNHLREMAAVLEDETGREPTAQELADRTGYSIKRIERINTFRDPLAQGYLESQQGVEGSPGALPAVQQESSAWIEAVYGDLSPVNQNILEWSLGLHGKPQLSNQEIAARLRLTPGAISQRKALIQRMLDQESELSPWR